jgi:lipoprotein-anchoring transpeptidase ErfK/SrfK
MKHLFKVAMATAVVMTMAIIPAEAAKKRKRYRVPSTPPTLQVHIDISSQSMSVRSNGMYYASWRVSTARAGYYTPRGTYSVKRLAKMHYSRKYDNAPMPHSVFFHGGYAIHGTGHLRALGRPASHGCVRLAPGNAAALYALVQRHGPGRTRITLTN